MQNNFIPESLNKSKRFRDIPLTLGRRLPRNKQWAMEIDYIDKLNDAEIAWLDKFAREFHEGAVKKGDPSAFHREPELRRDCYRRNNLQNRDLFSIKHCSGKLAELDGLACHVPSFENDVQERLDDPMRRFTGVVALALVFLSEILSSAQTYQAEPVSRSPMQLSLFASSSR